ncbi:MAG: YvcK family protein [Acidobacteria bacterium]|nr:YvcK family protein [Acidobacteriota bacterium]
MVLFSGGRGSGALARQLTHHQAIDLTVAINGYDDGASTGEVRRFLGDSLGPSDFRKNASRLATELSTAPAELVALLDGRLPVGCDAQEARAAMAAAKRGDQPWTVAVSRYLEAFERELDRTGRPFEFSDCSLGNLVFAGAFLAAEHNFNRAVADYCSLLNLPAGLVENVTDGTNAYLVAVDTAGRLLASEEDVVDAKRQNRIADIYLIGRPLEPAEQSHVAALSPAERDQFLEGRSVPVHVNPAVVAALQDADLIIYAPGTQHSSLFPSYLTPGLSAAIAGNLTAIKLLITNLYQDAEITGASAVDIINRALYYLCEKGRATVPTPCLITHYLLNDPGRESPVPYVPLGAVEALEDPRLVRIGNYEDGVTGHHDAEKLLKPFVASLLGSDREPTVAVYLHDADSPNKLLQTLLEMVRGGMGDLPLRVTVVHTAHAVDAGLAASLPFAVRFVAQSQVLDVLRGGEFEYVILFESSGMYRGEDIVALASQLAFVRLDAVWGSRRLSIRDVEEAMALRYRHNWWLKTASHLGSHLLSALYLVLFGRYISDTLSGARAVRAKYLRGVNVDPALKLANHQLLASLLRDRPEVLEIPVRFFPISPKRVKRTSVFEGFRAVWEIVVRRLSPAPGATRPEGGA